LSRPPFLAVALTGFTSTLGQILLVRELLVLFYGNELSTGLIFAAWLVWTAVGSGVGSRIADRFPPSPALLVIPLIGLALLLPGSILLVRAARPLWGVGPGEILPPLKMLSISFVATGPFCALSGFLFSFCWSVHARTAPATSPGRTIGIYLGEALGAAASGMLFYFLLLPHLPALACGWGVVVIVLCGSVWMLREEAFGRQRAAGIWLVGLAAASAGLLLLPDLESASRRWQWGASVVAVRDTPYHNLAMIKDESLYTAFANGLWLFSAPDPQLAETAVHPVLLQHPMPRGVLLAGGGAAGLAREILKHPSVERVDYVEPDPELIRMVRTHLPRRVFDALDDPRVRIFHEDPAAYIRAATRRYDVVLLNVGDPMNAEMNRFYTVEFYRDVQSRLAEGGIFSFSVSAAPDMVGPAQARFLRSVDATLKAAFPEILLLPGERARFLAGGEETRFITDPDPLMERMMERRLDLAYIREFYLLDLLDPFRRDYFETILSEGGTPPRINRDFRPVCYFHSIVLWGTQLHTGFKAVFLRVSEIGRGWLWTCTAVLCAGMIGLSLVRRRRPVLWVGSAVFLAGGAVIISQMVLLVGFQILAGYVYRQMALIISLFMAGLALGAVLAGRLPRRSLGPVSRLAAVQAGLCLYGLFLIGTLTILHRWPGGVPALWLGVVFSLLSVLGGMVGGGHFAMALAGLSGENAAPASVGGGLYALDLAGSALSAAGAALLLMPLYGPISAVLFVCLLLAANGVSLWIALTGRVG
jgi:spermidine synthase